MKTTKTRIIFFIIALIYNIISVFYLRDFLVLSPTLQAFYLLSALPALFLAVEIKTKTMRAAVHHIISNLEFSRLLFVFLKVVF